MGVPRFVEGSVHPLTPPPPGYGPDQIASYLNMPIFIPSLDGGVSPSASLDPTRRTLFIYQ